MVSQRQHVFRLLAHLIVLWCHISRLQFDHIRFRRVPVPTGILIAVVTLGRVRLLWRREQASSELV